MRKPFRRPFSPNQNEPRVNERIRKSPVRLIGADGSQLGIVPLEDAKKRAREASLDLVEVGATADPPVVKIMDWGKAKFDRDKKARESRKKAQTIEVKEVKFRPTIGDNDFNIKLNRAVGFLEKGKKVKVTVFFRYRQLRRPELGVQIMDKVTEMTAEIADVEHRSRLEGRQMVMVLAPKPHHVPAAESAKVSAKVSAKEPAKESAKVSAEEPAEVSAQEPAEEPAEVSAEEPAEVSAQEPAEVSAEESAQERAPAEDAPAEEANA